MATTKRWKASIEISVGSSGPVTFIGRRPFRAPDRDAKNALLALGVFKDLGGLSLTYSGKAAVPGKDGTQYEIGQDGQVSLDLANLPDEVVAHMDQEFE